VIDKREFGDRYVLFYDLAALEYLEFKFNGAVSFSPRWQAKTDPKRSKDHTLYRALHLACFLGTVLTATIWQDESSTKTVWNDMFVGHLAILAAAIDASADRLERECTWQWLQGAVRNVVGFPRRDLQRLEGI
jgi:hypothetical protein